MTARIVTSTWLFIGVVFLSATVARVDPISPLHAKTLPADVQTILPTPYAYMQWVKLGELVPMTANAEDVYVRLIAIEGEEFLPTDSGNYYTHAR